MIYDTVIVGNGPAGLTAAIYAQRAGLNTLVIAESPVDGGQIATTYEVDNYPGMKGIGGMELGMKFREHADQLETRFLEDRLVEIRDEGDHKTLILDQGEAVETKTVVLALGANHRDLGVPGEKELVGAGVSYCATCDGAFYRKKIAAVVGGGDVALEDALFLSRFAEKVYLIHRRDAFRGAKVLVDQVLAKENIEVIYDTVVEKVCGNIKVESLDLLNKKTGEKRSLPVNGVFMAVGTAPNVDVKGLPQQDEKGYIVADESCQTKTAGIYAAGDLRTKQLRQVITAAADGANAITSVQRYLTETLS
ncbi:MAG: thioredoxin-disulfide reductase [Lachnospiraceae bacterium]|nr:thioredoxin-disulfide reductase [Lachnospiraceae bacterium]MBQ5431631.1 thioredoxin-disulfide reductase [Lachnospiraceae bacterium]